MRLTAGQESGPHGLSGIVGDLFLNANADLLLDVMGAVSEERRDSWQCSKGAKNTRKCFADASRQGCWRSKTVYIDPTPGGVSLQPQKENSAALAAKSLRVATHRSITERGRPGPLSATV